MEIVQCIGTLRFCEAGLLLGDGGYENIEATTDVRFRVVIARDDSADEERCFVTCHYHPEDRTLRRLKSLPEVYFLLQLEGYERRFHAKLLEYDTVFPAGETADLVLTYKVIDNLQGKEC